MVTGIPIRGAATGTAARAYEIAVKRGAQRLDFTRAYFVSLYAVSAQLGINADVLVAQWDLETGRGTSAYWVNDGNPAGIAAFDDGTNWGLTFTPETAAGAQAAHMGRYLGIEVPDALRKLDARWDAVATAGYVGTVTTTADLGNGRWATDPDYAQKLYDRYVAYWGVPTTTTPTGAATVANKHIYVLSMGHRNNDRGGATGEYEWTPGATRAIRDHLVRLGATVYIVQEQDGDTDASFTSQGLGKIGGIVASLDKMYGPITAYLSIHYNSSPAGFHCVIPDSGGLYSAVQGKTITTDAWSTNTLDVTLARNIVKAVESTKTVKILSSTEKGLMSEKATYVGNTFGARISELNESIAIKDHAPRLILEAGGYADANDRTYLTNPAWLPVYAAAIAAGLRETFGAFPRDGVTVETPKPETVYGKPVDRPWMTPLLDGTKSRVLGPSGEHWLASQQVYVTTKRTPRQQYAIADGRVLNEDVPPNTPIYAAAVGQSATGEWWIRTIWGTMIKMDDCVPVLSATVTAG